MNNKVKRAKKKAKIAQARHERAVIEFATKRKGVFVILSDDVSFVRIMRTLSRDLFIGSQNVLVTQKYQELMRIFKNPDIKNREVVLIIERVLNGKNMISVVRNLRRLMDNLRIVVLTNEVEKHDLVLLHEYGANSIITKPISMSTLVKKLSCTIEPPTKISQMVVKAKEHLAAESYEAAMGICNMILADEFDSAAAHMIMGDALRAMGKHKEASENYITAAASAPMYLDPLKKLAALYGEMGRSDKQLQVLESLDKLSPLNVERKVNLGALCLEAGDKKRAREMFDGAVKITARNAKSLLDDLKTSIAERCFELDPSISAEFFRSVLTSRNGSVGLSEVPLMNRLAIALRRQGRWDEAVAEYDRALGISTNDENLVFNKAMALYEGGQHKEAIATVEQALALNPDFCSNCALAYNVGIMYVRARNREKAKEYFEKALEFNPDHPQAKHLLGKITVAA